MADLIGYLEPSAQLDGTLDPPFAEPVEIFLGMLYNITTNPPIVLYTDYGYLWGLRIRGQSGGVGDLHILGRNLFDKDNADIVTGRAPDDNGNIISESDTASIVFPVTPGTQYTISKQSATARFRVCTYAAYPAVGNTSLSYWNRTSASVMSCTFTAPVGAAYMMCFLCYNNSEAEVSEVLDGVMIEYGSTASAYEPYSCRYDIPVTVHGKNLFNKNVPDLVALYPALNDGTATMDPNNASYSLVVPLSSGGHTFSMIHVPDTPVRNRLRVACYDSYPQAGTTALSVDDSSERSGNIVYNTFTAPSGTAYAMIFLWTGSTYTMSVIEDVIENNDLMVEKSAGLTDFEPYFSNTVTVTVDSPLVAGQSVYIPHTTMQIPTMPEADNYIEFGTTVKPRVDITYRVD